MRAPILLALLLAAAPAAAQRTQCGLGVGIAGLDAADRAIVGAARARDLLAVRAAGERAAQGLRGAARQFEGCGCRRMAEYAAEAAGIAETATSAADAAWGRQVLDRAGLGLDQARTILNRAGCG